VTFEEKRETTEMSFSGVLRQVAGGAQRVAKYLKDSIEEDNRQLSAGRRRRPTADEAASGVDDYWSDHSAAVLDPGYGGTFAEDDADHAVNMPVSDADPRDIWIWNFDLLLEEHGQQLLTDAADEFLGRIPGVLPELPSVNGQETWEHQAIFQEPDSGLGRPRELVFRLFPEANSTEATILELSFEANRPYGSGRQLSMNTKRAVSVTVFFSEDARTHGSFEVGVESQNVHNDRRGEKCIFRCSGFEDATEGDDVLDAERWFAAETNTSTLFPSTSYTVDTVLSDFDLVVESLRSDESNDQHEFWKRTPYNTCALLDMSISEEVKREDIFKILDRHGGDTYRVPRRLAEQCRQYTHKKRRRTKLENVHVRIATRDHRPFDGPLFCMRANMLVTSVQSLKS